MRKIPAKLLAWAKSDEFREIARRQCAKMIAAHARAPRCGAHAKGTGEPCRQPAMKNGKCRFHGGRVPKGEDWHRVRWPNKSSPAAEKQLSEKLASLDKRAKKRAKRLAHRSPETREAYREWQKTHAPGSPQARAAARELRRRNQEARTLLTDLGVAVKRGPTDVALVEAIAAAEAQLKSIRLAREIEEGWTTGVFE